MNYCMQLTTLLVGSLVDECELGDAFVARYSTNTSVYLYEGTIVYRHKPAKVAIVEFLCWQSICTLDKKTMFFCLEN